MFSPFEFLKQPVNWLRTISDYRAYTSGAPNFAYDMCVSKVTAAEMQTLDLTSWRVAYSGAEPIRSSTLENFAAYFSTCGFQKSAFLPCYGLAEGTLIVTGGKRSQLPAFLACDKEMLKTNRVRCSGSINSDTSVLVGVGTALEQQDVKIVDSKKRVALGENEIGEIWVSGPSVAAGYWNNPEATQKYFQAKLKDDPDGSFLRTGDLGFLRDGELFVTGRLKDLIIIRGQNIYPSDIEFTVENSHSNLRKGCSAAFAWTQNREEKVVIVCEVKKEAQNSDWETIVERLRRDIFVSHGINVARVALIKAKTIPKTTSGKIQRKMCKWSWENRKLRTVYEWADT